MVPRWRLIFGGGAGDVWWEFLNTKEPQRIKYLVEEYGCRIQVLSRCHNPGAADIFRYNPYIECHILEDWRPPVPEDHLLFSQPSPDGYWPLQNNSIFFSEAGGEVPLNRVDLYLNREEQQLLARLTADRPCIVAHPWAGLSDRDAFNQGTLLQLAEELRALEPRVNLLVLGHNHERTHKYNREVAPAHPNIIDLVDKIGLRLGYHLVKHADAFVGSHSNLIRAAWQNRKRNALVMPSPMMTDHWPKLDAKYRYGQAFEETRIFTFPFGEGVPRNFEGLDVKTLAAFLLGRA